MTIDIDPATELPLDASQSVRAHLARLSSQKRRSSLFDQSTWIPACTAMSGGCFSYERPFLSRSADCFRTAQYAADRHPANPQNCLA